MDSHATTTDVCRPAAQMTNASVGESVILPTADVWRAMLMPTVPRVTATHATTTAAWSALGTLTAPTSSASWVESVCVLSPLAPRASPMPGAHLAPALLMYVPKLHARRHFKFGTKFGLKLVFSIA